MVGALGRRWVWGRAMADLQEQQESEVQALGAIYNQDFRDMRCRDTWQVRRPPEVSISLRPQGLTSCLDSHVSVELHVNCPANYPNVAPVISLKRAKGLSNEKLKQLQEELHQLAQDCCGEVMVFELARHTENYLSEHNAAPSGSFHEEMLRRQQEQQRQRVAQEQRRLEQIRQHQERMEREILDEIERREEEKREEKRRKDLAKQERLESAQGPSDAGPGSPVLPHSSSDTSNGNTDVRAAPRSGDKTRHRNTSSRRSRRERQFSVCSNEDGSKVHKVLRFSASSTRELTVHRGKSIGESETLCRSVFNAFEEASGSFVVIYEWVLEWRKKLGRFLTSEEQDKIERCKKQIHGVESELSSLLKVRHANLVQYLGMCCTEQEDSIVVNLLVEHVGGSSLGSVLRNGIPVPVDRLRHYAVQLLSVLDYLHGNSVVHKVLSAPRVLLDSEGNVRLTDYSISKRLADICKEDVFEQTRVRFSEDPLPYKGGKKGDVWRLGLLLLALSQGAPVSDYPVIVPPGLPADLQDFLHKCVCLEDKEYLSPQQLLQHSFINPTPAPTSHLQDTSQDDLGVAGYVEAVLPSCGGLASPLASDPQRQLSRYYSEFDELHLLGKGAFGAVIKVRNKLDGCYYAVKRILVNPTSKQFRRIKGEVTLLSRLNHENIVRYYNAWIERHEVRGACSPPSPSPSPSPAPPGSLDEVEGKAPPPVPSSSVEWSTSCERSASAPGLPEGQESSDDSDVFCASFLPDVMDSDSDIVFENGEESQLQELSPSGKNAGSQEESCQPVLCSVHHLYIQMEYCERSTLRDTIDQGLSHDTSRLWRLFREILDGLAYIHEQGMIHRDLKPVNIFLDSNDHVKIGDFGLATDHPANMATDTPEAQGSGSLNIVKPDPSGNLTGMVGTVLYVSPEVEGNTRASYNQKVDLFSLGVIFFEMSYHPMVTGSERVSVLSQLRAPTIRFPEDFDEEKCAKQRLVVEWLLKHDPAERPSAQELLRSECLPPPQLEAAELHEVLHHTLANTNSKAYCTLVRQILSQRVSPVAAYTYDIDMHRGSFSEQHSLQQQHVYEIVCHIFKIHGALRVQTPLLMPRDKQLYESSEVAYCMDHTGMAVMLPYDLRVPFARFVARSNISNLKRYCIERVFRPRKLQFCHPKELMECAFDIVTPGPSSLLPDAEVIYTVAEIIQEFPGLQARNYSVYLNHTVLLRAVLLHCGVPEDRLPLVCNILYDTSTGKLTRREAEAKLCNLSLSPGILTRLYKYLEEQVDVRELPTVLLPVTRGQGPASVMAEQGLRELQEVTDLLRKLSFKLQVVVSLGLVYKVQQHSGLIFQFMAFVRRRQRIVPDILAAGGRYDSLMLEFRGPQATGPCPSAVGVSLALDKISSIQCTTTDMVGLCRCETLVVAVGRLSMDRALNIVHKLWAAAIPAEVLYHVSQSQEEVQELCRQTTISYLVLVSDKESSHVKVRSQERERQVEKRVPEAELVEHITQKLRSKSSDERGSREPPDVPSSQSMKGNIASVTGLSESHGSAIVPNVTVVAPEKLSSSARRRSEAQVLSRLQTFVSNLQLKNNDIEVLAIDVSKETLISFLTLECDGDEESFDVSVQQLLSRSQKQRYLKTICDEIHHFKLIKRVSVLVLYSYRVDYYKTIF